jgi:hypothetical protein
MNALGHEGNLSTRPANDDAPRLVVTIDTEADSMWERPHAYTFRNTRGLGRLQDFLEARGFLPTYLVTHEVATDPESAALLGRFAREGRAEVGSHLHPWSNPPFTRVCDDEDRHHPFPHDYELEVFAAKMRTLGDVLRDRLGVTPVSYRAGRWGFTGAHAPLLERLGYVVDTTVTPGVSWESTPGRPGGRGGTSYAGAPRVPYRLSARDITRPASTGLVEVPVSIEWSRRLPPVLESWMDRIVRVHSIARVLRRTNLLRAVWLRPYPRYSEDDLRALCDRLHERRRPVWNVMFHSSEATEGTSPYSRDKAELEVFYRKLGVILERARELGVVPATLTGFVHRWQRAAGTHA